IRGSTGPLADLTYHDLAADVAAVLRAIIDTPAVVIGHAFGGRVARTLARDEPTLVDRLVLLAAAGPVARSRRIEVVTTRFWETELSPEERAAAIREVFFAGGSDANVWREG